MNEQQLHWVRDIKQSFATAILYKYKADAFYKWPPNCLRVQLPQTFFSPAIENTFKHNFYPWNFVSYLPYKLILLPNFTSISRKHETSNDDYIHVTHGPIQFKSKWLLLSSVNVFNWVPYQQSLDEKSPVKWFFCMKTGQNFCQKIRSIKGQN